MRDGSRVKTREADLSVTNLRELSLNTSSIHLPFSHQQNPDLKRALIPGNDGNARGYFDGSCGGLFSLTGLARVFSQTQAQQGKRNPDDTVRAEPKGEARA